MLFRSLAGAVMVLSQFAKAWEATEQYEDVSHECQMVLALDYLPWSAFNGAAAFVAAHKEASYE